MPFKIVGTSHISKQSVNEIRQAFEAFNPSIVAVELDVKRLHALLTNKKPAFSLSSISKIGFKGFLFAWLGAFIQRKLGKIVGLAPGSDMLEAVKLSKGRQLALIDRDIQVTLRRFSQALTWKERFRFLGDIIRGILNPKAELKRYNLDTLDLTKVPSDKIIISMISQLKLRYPNIYKVLIEERNNFMISKLKQLSSQFPEASILVVVGAGHKEELENGLEIR